MLISSILSLKIFRFKTSYLFALISINVAITDLNLFAQQNVNEYRIQAENKKLEAPPILETIPEIKTYIRNILDTPLPVNYIYPDYIANAGNREEATKIVGERYPEFFMKEGSQYLEAVKEYPIRFREMIFENKAIREYFIFSKKTTKK